MEARTLFDTPEVSSHVPMSLPPPAPVGVRPPTRRSQATSLPVSEAKKERLIHRCSCDCPPGFALVPEVLIFAFEEGTSHITDDGLAEAQRKMDVIGSQLVDLGIAVEAILGRVVSAFADLTANSPVQEFFFKLFILS